MAEGGFSLKQSASIDSDLYNETKEKENKGEVNYVRIGSFVCLFLLFIGLAVFIGFVLTEWSKDPSKSSKVEMVRVEYQGTLKQPINDQSKVGNSGSSNQATFEFGDASLALTTSQTADPTKYVQAIAICKEDADSKTISGFKLTMSDAQGASTEEVLVGNSVTTVCTQTYTVPAKKCIKALGVQFDSDGLANRVDLYTGDSSSLATLSYDTAATQPEPGVFGMKGCLVGLNAAY